MVQEPLRGNEGLDVTDERTPQQGWGQPPAAPGGPPQPPQQGWGQPPAAPGGPPQPPQQGWPPSQPGWGAPAAQPRGTNGLAIAALVCGLVAVPLAIVLVGGLVGVVAVILGIAGLTRVRTTGSGRGMAIGGIVAGALGVIIALVLIAVTVRVFSDPEVQDLIEQEIERQEQLLEEQQQD